MQRDILLDSQIDPALVAYKLTGELGWLMHRAGEAFILQKCYGQSVQISPQPHCYNMIPIQRNSSAELEFMHPVTRMISKLAVRVSCSDAVNPLFQVRGSWYRLSPLLISIPSPTAYTSSLKQVHSSFIKMGSGLYQGDVLAHMDDQRSLASLHHDTLSLSVIQTQVMLQHHMTSQQYSDSFSSMISISSYFHLSQWALYMVLIMICIWNIVNTVYISRLHSRINMNPQSLTINSIHSMSASHQNEPSLKPANKQTRTSAGIHCYFFVILINDPWNLTNHYIIFLLPHK